MTIMGVYSVGLNLSAHIVSVYPEEVESGWRAFLKVWYYG